MVGNIQNRPQADRAAQVGAANHAEATAQAGALNGRQVRQEPAQPRAQGFLTRIFNQLRTLANRLFGARPQAPVARNPELAAPQANANVARAEGAPRPLAPDQLRNLVMTSIANGGGGLQEFLEIAGFREDKTGFMHHQEDVIKKNPIMQEVLSRIQALNEQDPGSVPKSMDQMANLALNHVVQIKAEQAGQ